MALSELWLNFVNSYPAGDEQNAMDAFAESVYNSGTGPDFIPFTEKTTEEISKFIQDLPTNSDFNSYDASQFISILNGLTCHDPEQPCDGWADCTPEETVALRFYQLIRPGYEQGVPALVETLKKQIPLNITKLEDIRNLSDSELTSQMEDLSCSHMFNQGRASAVKSEALQFLSSITTTKLFYAKFEDEEDNILAGYRVDWSKTAADPYDIIISGNTDESGYIAFPYNEIEDAGVISSYLIVRDHEDNVIYTSGAMDYPPSGPILLPIEVDYTIPSVYPKQLIDSAFLLFISLDLSPGMVSYLSTKGVETLEDILSLGGLQYQSDLLTGTGDLDAAKKLDAYANLTIITRDVEVTKILYNSTSAYRSIYQISKLTRSKFINSLWTGPPTPAPLIGDYNAYELYIKAQAVTAYIQNLITAQRTNNA